MKGNNLPESASTMRVKQLEQRVYTLTSELQAARAELAEYREMMGEVRLLEFMDWSKVFRPCRSGEYYDERWRHLDADARSGDESHPTALAAYKALKEATR